MLKEVIYLVYITSRETQRRKDARKGQIIKSALEIFSERGYDGTTIKDIVQASGTSIGNFYFYFKSKEDLFELLYDEMSTMLNRLSDFALNRDNISVVKGFCRSKTSELWAFQHCNGLARALMIEGIGDIPRFEKKRLEIFNNSNERIERVFIGLSNLKLLDISDTKISSLLCNGTMYHVIMDWLQGDRTVKLTDYSYQIITFNLNAFKIDYQNSDVKLYINDMLEELETDFTMFE